MVPSCASLSLSGLASRSTSVSIDGLTRTAHRSTPEAFPAHRHDPQRRVPLPHPRLRAAPLPDRTTLIFASLQFPHRDLSDGRPVPRSSSARRIATRIHQAHLHTPRGCSEAELANRSRLLLLTHFGAHPRPRPLSARPLPPTRCLGLVKTRDFHHHGFCAAGQRHPGHRPRWPISTTGPDQGTGSGDVPCTRCRLPAVPIPTLPTC